MLTSPDWLEPNKRYLHRHQQSHNVENRVTDKQPLRKAAHDEQHEDMEWYKIDDEHITTPC